MQGAQPLQGRQQVERDRLLRATSRAFQNDTGKIHIGVLLDLDPIGSGIRHTQRGARTFSW